MFSIWVSDKNYFLLRMDMAKVGEWFRTNLNIPCPLPLFPFPLILSVTHMFFIPGSPWAPGDSFFPADQFHGLCKKRLAKEQMKDANNGNKNRLWDSYVTMGIS